MRKDILERKDEILQWIAEEKPKVWIAQQLQCKQETLNNYLARMGIEYAGQRNKIGQQKGPRKYVPVIEYIQGSYVRSALLKEKLLREGYKENYCEICGLSEWLGKPLILELHHKDGNHYNNNLNNLMILCPNCHSQTEFFRGRNTSTSGGTVDTPS